MKIICTKDKLKPSGHYSQAMIHNDTIYISTQLPIDPETGEKAFGSIEFETNRILENLEIILTEAGCKRANIISTTVYLSDLSLWDQVNEVYKDFFKDHKPVRTMVSVNQVHYGFKIAIEAKAAI